MFGNIETKEPKRNPDGTLDLEWWRSLSLNETWNYNLTDEDCLRTQEHSEQNNKNGPQEVVIKPELLDTSELEEGEGNKTIFRPSDWNEYIGQHKAKKKLQARLKATRKLGEQFPHTFLYGKAGTGKTTLAYILAEKLGIKMVQCVGGDLKSEQQFIDKLVEAQGGIIFVDEIHKLKNRVGNFMLPIVEDFHVQGRAIKPFTLLGATTEPGELIKHLSPLYQRFEIKIELENYTEENLVDIFKQFHKKKYHKFKVPENVYYEIAKNCKGTPRIGLSLLKEYICLEDIQEVFEANDIVKEGLTGKDVKALQYLNENPKGVGANTISKFLGTSRQNYDHQIEPYLIEKGLMQVSHRRKITPKGQMFLSELEKED